MNGTKQSGEAVGIFKAIGVIFRDVLYTAESVGFCCGIRLDRAAQAEVMPTASSCCGVRV